ncbi:MAG: efflux RND transporter periplasmic adaptor subunit [Pseudomonadota bacterium]
MGYRQYFLFCSILIALFAMLWSPAIAQEGAQPPKVSIAAAYTENITDAASFIGRGEAIDRVDLVARVSGFVQDVPVSDGARVEAGDLLYRIEPDAYEAALDARNADLARAEANLQLAGIELARKTELLARGAAPESEVDIARANELVAEAEVKAANAAIRNAELDLSYTDVVAPFEGRIGRVNASVGELVGPSTEALATIIREAPIYVRFSISERGLVDVAQEYDTTAADLPSAPVSPDVFVTLSNGTDLDETGKIVFIDNAVDTATGTISLLAEFANEDALLTDGAFVSVRIEALEPTQQTLIPQAALQRDQRGDFVLIVTSDSLVEQRYVTLGDQVGTAVIVLDGIRPGESVIVEGLQRVRPGVEVDAVLAGQATEGQ